MSKFLTKLAVEQIEDVGEEGRGTWRLLSPLSYQSDLLGATLTVPTGFITDFASVPRVPFAFWFLADRANEAATLHDWLYSTDSSLTHPVTDRSTADAILKEAAIAQGCPSWVAYALLAGCSYWRMEILGMSTLDDMASDAEMRDRALCEKVARAKNQPLAPVTHCLYCNESIAVGRYCSAECREDGEMEATIRGRQFR